MSTEETKAITKEESTDGRWIPLESNPEVLNSWASKLGLEVEVSRFEDVYGLDADLLGLVPQPSKAIILLFPSDTNNLFNSRREEDEKIKAEGQHPTDPTLIFIRQNIENACGTIALLHAIGNSDVTLDPTSPLAKFFEECHEKTPGERSAILEKTPLFAQAHVDAAVLGQTPVPDDINSTLHFIVFVKAPSPKEKGTERIVELDGRRPVPVDQGECKDFLQDVANIVKKKYISESTSQSFGMMSLGPKYE